VGDLTRTEGVGPWAVRHFGADLARELWHRVPAALAAAVGHALDAHAASLLRTNHAFGNARWPGQYEELVRHLGDLPGAQVVRPHTAFYELVVIRDHLFLPWCPGDGGRRPGRVVRGLLRRYGPAPRFRQPVLFALDDGAPGDEPTAGPLDDLGFAPRVTLIEYACTASQGLTDLAWGSATCDDGGEVHWLHREPLPLPRRIPRQRPAPLEIAIPTPEP
jgi:hypothetical protein